MPVNILLVTVMCFGLSKHSTFRTILLRCYRVSHNNCVLDMCNPCAALTQTHPELFSTMSTILISLPTPMRRVSVCYEMELESHRHTITVRFPQHLRQSHRNETNPCHLYYQERANKRMQLHHKGGGVLSVSHEVLLQTEHISA